MQKIISCTIVAFLLDFASCTTMLEVSKEPSSPKLYRVETRPIEVEQEAGILRLFAWFERPICSKRINILTAYNGYLLRAPLIINGEMTQEEMIAALEAAFGVRVTVQNL